MTIHLKRNIYRSLPIPLFERNALRAFNFRNGQIIIIQRRSEKYQAFSRDMHLPLHGEHRPAHLNSHKGTGCYCNVFLQTSGPRFVPRERMRLPVARRWSVIILHVVANPVRRAETIQTERIFEKRSMCFIVRAIFDGNFNFLFLRNNK